ncbi:MAG: hypothetical protein Q4B81_00260 [Moraxella sp.]|nr:hypothetical protein [Moraxella sp.]
MMEENGNAQSLIALALATKEIKGQIRTINEQSSTQTEQILALDKDKAGKDEVNTALADLKKSNETFHQQQDDKISTKADISYVDDIKQSLQDRDNEIAQALEAKASLLSVNELKSTVDSQNKTVLEKIKNHEQALEQKTTLQQVKTMIAEAELDDLTLEQVQREILSAVADKAATQAVNEKNQQQDDKISTKADISYVDDIKQSLQDRDNEIAQSLANKANTSALDELKEQLTTLVGTDIKNIADATKDKVTKGELQEVKDALATKISNTELSAGLQSKVNTATFNQKMGEITQSIEAKANSTHTHQMSDVVGLSNALNNKANAVHTHSFNAITDRPETYPPSQHNHTMDDITGLNDRLSALVSNEALQNLLKQYSPIAVKAAVEQLQNSLATKADNTQLESLRELIESVSGELSGANLSDLTNKASKDEVNVLKRELTTLINAKANATALSAYMTTEQATQLLGTKTSTATQVNAGNGLTGGGRLSGDVNIALGTPSKITANSTNTVSENTHSHEIDKASDTVAGIVKLSHETNGTDRTKAASEYALGQAVNALQVQVGNKVVTWDDLSNKPAQFNPTSHTHPWSQITGVPSFAPSSHTHRMDDISGLANALGNKLDVSGNAVSASKLAKTVRINGIEFDGTKNINIPVESVNVIDNLTTENANSALSANQGVVLKGLIDSKIDANGMVFAASKLTTPRRINGVSFDGTRDITIPIPNNAVSLHTDKGYIKFPDGTIIQWIEHPITLNSIDNLTQHLGFPISFPNKAASVSVSVIHPSSSSNVYAAHVTSLSRALCVVFLRKTTTQTAAGEYKIQMIAIGY